MAEASPETGARPKAMDFSLTDEEAMILDATREFARRCLEDHDRDQEKGQTLSAATTSGFSQSGLDLLTQTRPGHRDDGMDVSWPARCKALVALAQTDAAAALALWMPGTTQAIARELGVTDETTSGLSFVHFVDQVSDSPPEAASLPLGIGKKLLVLDHEGAWGLASLETEPTHSLALHAAGAARITGASWTTRGEVDAGIAMRIRNGIRLCGASLLVGLCHAATDYTATYIQERIAFGKPLAHHQGVAFLFAEMAMRTEGAELLMLRAGWDLEQDKSEASCDAWLEAIDASLWVTDQAVQLLGGHGYMKDHPVEKWMREARAISLLWGGADAARCDANHSLDLAPAEA